MVRAHGTGARVRAHPTVLGLSPGYASRDGLAGEAALERRPDLGDVQIGDVIGAPQGAAGDETSADLE